jgi:membrane fusion protein, adhesin transport system
MKTLYDSTTDIEREEGSKNLWIVVAALMMLVIFFIWANCAELDQIARAQGQVIAKARTQVVQSANDGVVQKLLVSDGERVRKGQLIVQLEREQAIASQQDSLAKVAALKARLIRLRAEVFSRPLNFPDDVQAYPEFVNNQTELYWKNTKAFNAQINNFKESLDLVEQELNLNRPLLESGDIGKVEIIRLQIRVAEYEGKITNLSNSYLRDAQDEMGKAEEELATQEQVLTERTVVLERTEIKAPSDGLVKELMITTPGARVRPGDVILELFPTDSTLIVEAKLKPSDVAFVLKEMASTVKLDAYDSSIFGGLDGKVDYISPDALKDKTSRGEEIYYRVQMKIDEESLIRQREKHSDKEINIQPGMTGTVEIKTGTKTAWAYLTKPITKTLSESLTER